MKDVGCFEPLKPSNDILDYSVEFYQGEFSCITENLCLKSAFVGFK